MYVPITLGLIPEGELTGYIIVFTDIAIDSYFKRPSRAVTRTDSAPEENLEHDTSVKAS